MLDRICKTCKEIKKIEEFPQAKGNKDGRKPYRKECNKKYAAAATKKSKQKKGGWQVLKNSPSVMKYKESGRRWAVSWKNKLGVDIDPLQMLKDQGFKCKICEIEITYLQQDGKKRAAVDHCHTTGKIRGILCWNCNIFLGYYEKRLDMREKFDNYLAEQN